MKTRIKKDLIETIVPRWEKQYPPKTTKGQWKTVGNELKRERRFLTEQRINEIIGNDSWMSNRCTECGEDMEVLMRLGEEPDYESSTVFICENCLNIAMETLKNENKKNKRT